MSDESRKEINGGDSIAKKEDTSGEKNKPNLPANIQSSFSEDPFDSKPTPRNHIHVHCPEPKEKAWKDKLEIGGFSLALIVAIVLVWQGCEMHRTTVSAEKQLREMQQSRILDERAWVFADVEKYTLHRQNDVFIFGVGFKNSGKTPALHVGAVLDAKPVPNINPPSFVALGPHAPSDLVVAPDSTFYGEISVDTGIFNTTPTNSREWFEKALMNGKIRFDFCGIIYYEDIFQRPHWSSFSAYLSTNFEFIAFPYNSCDDSQTNQTR